MVDGALSVNKNLPPDIPNRAAQSGARAGKFISFSSGDL